jgi:hypothetical protein
MTEPDGASGRFEKRGWLSEDRKARHSQMTQFGLFVLITNPAHATMRQREGDCFGWLEMFTE